MPWQFFIFSSIILFSISTLIQKTNLKHTKINPISYSAFFQIGIGLTFFIFVYFTNGFKYISIQEVILNFLIAGVIYGWGSISLFKALAITEASKFTILFSTRTFFTILAALLIFHQTLSLLQVIGTLLIFSSVIVVTWEKKSFVFKKEDILSLFCAFLFGIGVINDKIILNATNVNTYLGLAFLIPGIFIFLFKPQVVRDIHFLKKTSTLLRLILLCTIYASQAVLFYIGLSLTTQASLVGIINSTTVIITVILSVIFLKERDKLSQKILGTIIAFLGLVLVAL